MEASIYSASSVQRDTSIEVLDHPYLRLEQNKLQMIIPFKLILGGDYSI
jgi:hypothetical protein